MGIYIRNGHLAALHQYKYAGQDKSMTSKYLLNPFWNKFATIFPTNMAPNAITLTGFAFVVVNFITLLIYTPTLEESCPAWVYASWGVGLFFYQAFDACDGKQARKLGLSGPLGECFDHGVDALNTTVPRLLSTSNCSWRLFCLLRPRVSVRVGRHYSVNLEVSSSTTCTDDSAV
jgi:ethanolaminephosphotransferase